MKYAARACLTGAHQSLAVPQQVRVVPVHLPSQKAVSARVWDTSCLSPLWVLTQAAVQSLGYFSEGLVRIGGWFGATELLPPGCAETSFYPRVSPTSCICNARCLVLLWRAQRPTYQSYRVWPSLSLKSGKRSHMDLQDQHQSLRRRAARTRCQASGFGA